MGTPILLGNTQIFFEIFNVLISYSCLRNSRNDQTARDHFSGSVVFISRTSLCFSSNFNSVQKNWGEVIIWKGKEPLPSNRDNLTEGFE